MSYLLITLGGRWGLGMEGETLVIIEVQRGAYTGEDDIKRLEDDYDRAQ